MSWRFRPVTCLMCANSFCGQKDCYCAPSWVHGQIMFAQLQRNHAKYSSQTTDFSLFLFSSNHSLTNCFRQAFDFSNICIQPWQTQWLSVFQELRHGLWMTCILHPDVKCHVLKVQKKGPAAVQTWPDPVVCASAGARCLKQPKKEMSHYQKFRVTKKTDKIKSLSFNANVYDSPWSLDSSLNRKHILYKTRHQQKNNPGGSFCQSLGSPFTHRVGWLWTPTANVPRAHPRSSDISDASQRPSHNCDLKGDPTPYLTAYIFVHSFHVFKNHILE